MSAQRIIDMHFGEERLAEIALQSDPAYVHPRQVKLDIIRDAMGAEKYAAWYERNSHLNVAKWEALIEMELALLVPADNAVVHARLEALEADIEAAGAEVSGAMLEEWAELRGVLNGDGDAQDEADHAEEVSYARNGY